MTLTREQRAKQIEKAVDEIKTAMENLCEQATTEKIHAARRNASKCATKLDAILAKLNISGTFPGRDEDQSHDSSTSEVET
ncbi:hypothetical protein OROHE_001235 [Orobanche hederae]